MKAMEENGHRPAEHVRVDHQRHPGARLREQDRGRFKPTMLGMMLVEKLLSPAFDDILDVEYTRNLEEDLDKIEEGQEDYESTLSSFYKKFAKDLKRAAKEMVNLKEGVEPTPPVVCDKCGKPMVIKAGKFGLFLACSGYPGVREHAGARNARAGAEGEIEENCARTAASRWRSSAAGSGSSSPAPAIPSARPHAS